MLFNLAGIGAGTTWLRKICSDGINYVFVGHSKLPGGECSPTKSVPAFSCVPRLQKLHDQQLAGLCIQLLKEVVVRFVQHGNGSRGSDAVIFPAARGVFRSLFRGHGKAHVGDGIAKPG